MTDFTPQSTNTLPDNDAPNYYTHKEIARGYVDITVAAQAVGYAGSAQVNIPQVEINNEILEVEVTQRQPQGGGSTNNYYKLPYTNISSSGSVHDSAYYYVTAGSFLNNTILTLNIVLFNLTLPSNPSRFFWKVMSTRSAPTNTGTW
jgi:hypothetical protein